MASPSNAEKELYQSKILVRTIISIFIIFLLSILLVSNYISDAINRDKVEVIYWFVSDIQGVRHLNAAGIYYVVLNFSLLFITFLGGASFIAVSLTEVIRAKSLFQKSDDFERYRSSLFRMSHAYVYGTALVFTYTANILIWKNSPLGGGTQENINIATIALLLIGLILVTLPRRYAEYLWATKNGGDYYENYRSIINHGALTLVGLVAILFVIFFGSEPWFLKLLEDVWNWKLEWKGLISLFN